MADERRIQQFRQMAEADPENELGHFSLGKAYLEAGRFTEAIASLERALALNPRMSKAYQLLAEAYHEAGEGNRAIDVATRGVAAADKQGDRMPRDAMVELLQSWGAPVPAFVAAAPPAAAEGDTSAPGFRCARCGRPSGQLPKPPFKGALGEKVFAHTCSICWREWIGMGTKVINELGLQLASKAGQDAYDQYMGEFLQLDQL
ncbi:MAG: Fe(2+)-trafficking protein [Planctomycetes bacterium]|nr:Fe(2+)-trafficking protein [Planctomycetota bacterium]